MTITCKSRSYSMIQHRTHEATQKHGVRGEGWVKEYLVVDFQGLVLGQDMLAIPVEMMSPVVRELLGCQYMHHV